jgi:hypothetical protein
MPRFALIDETRAVHNVIEWDGASIYKQKLGFLAVPLPTNSRVDSSGWVLNILTGTFSKAGQPNETISIASIVALVNG